MNGKKSSGRLPVDVINNVTCVGLQASGVAQTGNPVLTGGVYNHSQNLTAGQVGVTNMDQYGDTVVSPRNTSASETDAATNSVNLWRAPDTSAVFTSRLPSLFNGTTWDRNRNNVEATIFASAARTATANSTDQVNYNARGILLILDITAVSGTTPTLDVKVQYKDPVSAAYVDIPSAAFAQKTATGTDSLLLYPGITSTANRQILTVLSRTWRAVATIGGTTPSFTFSLGCSYVL